MRVEPRVTLTVMLVFSSCTFGQVGLRDADYSLAFRCVTVTSQRFNKLRVTLGTYSWRILGSNSPSELGV